MSWKEGINPATGEFVITNPILWTENKRRSLSNLLRKKSFSNSRPTTTVRRTSITSPETDLILKRQQAAKRIQSAFREYLNRPIIVVSSNDYQIWEEEAEWSPKCSYSPTNVSPIALAMETNSFEELMEHQLFLE